MTSAQVVCNSSPLIALDQIGQLDLLERLFGSVLAPPAVAREIAPKLVLPAWVTEQALTQPLGPQSAGQNTALVVTLSDTVAGLLWRVPSLAA